MFEGQWVALGRWFFVHCRVVGCGVALGAWGVDGVMYIGDMSVSCLSLAAGRSPASSFLAVAVSVFLFAVFAVLFWSSVSVVHGVVLKIVLCVRLAVCVSCVGFYCGRLLCG